MTTYTIGTYGWIGIVTNATGRCVSYAYDANGNMTGVSAHRDDAVTIDN